VELWGHSIHRVRVDGVEVDGVGVGGGVVGVRQRPGQLGGQWQRSRDSTALILKTKLF
jgi:hypothetical protein